MGRGQIPLPLLEAAVGVLLLSSLALLLATGVSGPATDRAQLDAYAADAGRLLANEPPRHANRTRLSEVAASADAFDRERRALARRVERLLPPNLFYQVRTPQGRIGHTVPDGVPVGTRTVTTAGGSVTIRVWYG